MSELEALRDALYKLTTITTAVSKQSIPDIAAHVGNELPGHVGTVPVSFLAFSKLIFPEVPVSLSDTLIAFGTNLPTYLTQAEAFSEPSAQYGNQQCSQRPRSQRTCYARKRSNSGLMAGPCSAQRADALGQI